MAGFVQIIEIQTSRVDELRALGDKYQSDREADADESVGPRRILFAADKDRSGFFLNIVEFESAEVAMENSNRPDTSEFAAQMAELCDAPPKFYNLEVMERWER
jgi:hypothetical protein